MSGKRALQRTKQEGRSVRNIIKALHAEGITNEQIALSVKHLTNKPTSPTHIAEVGTGRYRTSKKQAKAIVGLTPEKVLQIVGTTGKQNKTPIKEKNTVPPTNNTPSSTAKADEVISKTDPVITPAAYSDTPRNSGQVRLDAVQALVHRLLILGFKQKHISDVLNKHFSSVSNWINRVSAPHSDTYATLFNLYQNVMFFEIAPPERCKPILKASKYGAASKEQRRESTMLLMFLCLQGMSGDRSKRMASLFELSAISVARQMSYTIGNRVPHQGTYEILLEVLELVTTKSAKNDGTVTPESEEQAPTPTSDKDSRRAFYEEELQRLLVPNERGKITLTLLESITNNLTNALDGISEAVKIIRESDESTIGGPHYKEDLSMVANRLRTVRDCYLQRYDTCEDIVGTRKEVAALKTLIEHCK